MLDNMTGLLQALTPMVYALAALIGAIAALTKAVTGLIKSLDGKMESKARPRNKGADAQEIPLSKQGSKIKASSNKVKRRD
ncbi:MAG: hypothetical protein ACLP7P_06535 [Rhodomicrobium sp.]